MIERLRNIAETNSVQYGFMPDKNIIDVIIIVSQLLEKKIEDTYCC